ncbi:MAG: VOC family protein, partial [Hyphomicrobiaceae bacterium]|nr:VOC family protein [Hyphomicrobiaceae bacterium]
MPTTSSPATAMRYRDVAAATDWLCEAFGFQEQTVLTDTDGVPIYAQLTFGRALIMLAPVGDSPIERFMKQPEEIGGAETQSCYFVIPDADAHHARAKAAGAEVILPVDDDEFGGRGYTCRDPEGHIWTFGTYDPWQGKFPEAPSEPPPAPRGGRRVMLAGLSTVFIVAVGAAAWVGGSLTQSSEVSSTAQVSAAALEAAEQ